MSKIVIILCAGLGVCAAFVLLLIRYASEGHEDERGFHRGPADESIDPPAGNKPKGVPQDATSSAPSAKK